MRAPMKTKPLLNLLNYIERNVKRGDALLHLNAQSKHAWVAIWLF